MFRETGRLDGALAIEIPGLQRVANAVEAGPLLLAEGRIAIDMEREGWKTRTSIQSQAARIDYLDMRGPKIAIGLDDQGTLVVLAVNGRIRESVGATHVDMAEILLASVACEARWDSTRVEARRWSWARRDPEHFALQPRLRAKRLLPPPGAPQCRKRSRGLLMR